MAQYDTLNVKLSNSQLNKLKSGIKNGTEVTLNLSSNVSSNSNDETNFPRKLLLTNTQVSRIRKTFANGSLPNKKFSKPQLSKLVQLGGSFLFDSLGIFDLFPPFKMNFPNSFGKELKDTNPKE